MVILLLLCFVRCKSGMKRRVRIKKICNWSIVITIGLAILFAFISMQGEKEFEVLKDTTDQYIVCENAAKQLQDGSDYLTEQVRLYAMTGQPKYREQYFQEAKETRRRENALDALKCYFDGADSFKALQEALNYSRELMETEYYSMRLRAEATDVERSAWPEEIKAVMLSQEDELLSTDEKIVKSQRMVSDNEYQKVRTEITDNVSACMNSLIEETRNQQGRATTIFSDMYLKLEVGIALLVVLMAGICAMVSILIVRPLTNFNESIKQGQLLPVVGSAELQKLAETYNQVYIENQETQKIIRHQAEHDALTGALNRGYFEKILRIYESGEASFALILADVDVFKSVNDTYGHAIGDKILKKVAELLQKTFRSIDYICRIGGDEFAIVMVEMKTDLQYTIREKIDFVNQVLEKQENGLPKVSLSVGVAFADRANPGESIFKDADKALYYVKEHGKGGCSFYGE